MMSSKYQNIHSGFVTVDVSPTFISSDLHTPAAKSRVTLPSIAKFSRPIQNKESNCWGAVTVRSIGLPRRDVSNHKYGSGCFNYHAPYQPYRITALKLSHCRKNDQLLCPPENGQLILDKMIHLPWPRCGTNSSHVSKLTLFPQPFNDTASENPTEQERYLESLKSSLYCTTGYKETFRNHTIQSSHDTGTLTSDQACQLLQATDDNVAGPSDSYSDTSTVDSPSRLIVQEISGSVSIGVQTDPYFSTTDSFSTAINIVKKDYVANPIVVEIDNNSCCAGPSSEVKKDASTQTMSLVSLVRRQPRTSTPYLCGHFPAIPHLMTSTPADLDRKENKLTSARVCLYQGEDRLTTRFRARLRYNERYGATTTTRLSCNRKDGKKMYFYGEHTSMFR